MDYPPNPPGCSCEFVHRSNQTCPSKAPSYRAIADRPDPVRRSLWQAILACDPEAAAEVVVGLPIKAEEPTVELFGELVDQAPPEVRRFWRDAMPRSEAEVLINQIEMTLERVERGQLTLDDLEID